MNMDDRQHRSILQKIAHRAMLQRGLLPGFSSEALAEVSRIQAPAAISGEQVRDLRGLLWASIDNDDSRDLDQLTVAEAMPGDKVKILVAVADVDAIVYKGSAIDEHARHNTTSVYTAGRIFPMLPEKLSTDLTSLNFDVDRLAIVVEMVIGADGYLKDSDIYRASVHNHAKLAYNSVAAWLEDFMIGANGVTARYLSSRRISSIRRIVRTPKRWKRIVELADEHGSRLRDTPDSKALEEFLTREKAADPVGFPDLSLAVIKLMGAGEYIAELPGENAPGHFGLAVRDYTHSTAPNRRYPDLITQRLLKAAIGESSLPYSNDELEALAKHCTEKEDAANKVERLVRKSAAAMLLEHRIGEQFDAIVTGAAEKGTWARLLTVPVEGRVIHGFKGLDVGNRIRVQLTFVDVDRGYIDFRKVGPLLR